MVCHVQSATSDRHPPSLALRPLATALALAKLQTELTTLRAELATVTQQRDEAREQLRAAGGAR